MDLAGYSRFWFAPELEACVHSYAYTGGAVDSFAHTHDEYNFVFCLEPALRYEVRGRIVDLGRGDLLVINPGDLHHGIDGQRLGRPRGLSLHISIRELRRLVHRMRIPTGPDSNRLLFLDTIRCPDLLPLLEELCAEVEATSSGSDLLANSLLIQIFVLLLRQVLAPTVLPVDFEVARQLPSWQMVRALEYMNERGKSEFSLTELCAEAGSSISRFIPLFKASTGDVSPHAFHNRLLALKAENLLLSTAYPVKEIGIALGFQTESHFCRAFRLHSGDTPGNWRARRLMS